MTIKEPKENLPVAFGRLFNSLIISQFEFDPSIKCFFLFALASLSGFVWAKALRRQP
jgi:hypothetical protein